MFKKIPLFLLLLTLYSHQSYAGVATQLDITVDSIASTCNTIGTNGANITIKAVDSTHTVDTTYNGTITLSTSDGHGDWQRNGATGNLTQGATDSGTATYAFRKLTDKGIATFYLDNEHADNLTITSGGLLGSSTNIQFNSNQYSLTPDPIQVAGKPNSMQVDLYTTDASLNQCNQANNYTGIKAVKIWITKDVSDPNGILPTIGGVTLPTTMPSSANFNLDFSTRSASFDLDTTDVGKYTINIRDASSFSNNQNIDGNSGLLTFKPFVVVFSNIMNGATNNPSTITSSGAIFQKAGLPFSVTATGYLWALAGDVGRHGIPDAGATLGDVTAGGIAPHFAWDTTLTTTTPFYPATPIDSPVGTGVAGALANATISKASFSNGSGTTTTVNYSEVGSFSLDANITNYLNTTGIIIPTFPTIVGRFIPDHFVVSSTGITNRSDLNCIPASTFNYMDENMRSYITITAQNAANATTQNYVDTYAKFPNTIPNWNIQSINSGTKLTPRTAGLTANGSFISGVYTGYLDFYLSRLVNPDGPYNNLQVGIAPVDTDGVLTTGLNLNVSGTNVYQIGTSSVRFGRLHMYNNSGSDLLPLGIRMATEYYTGTSFTTNTADNCSGLTQSNFAFNNFSQNLQATEVSVTYVNPNFSNGTNIATISKPSGGDGLYDGSTNLTYNLSADGKTYLQGKWTGGVGSYTENPTAKATFAKQNYTFTKILNYQEIY